jgi:hypothetical protein
LYHREEELNEDFLKDAKEAEMVASFLSFG